jgi:hypothetical protein
MRCWYIIIKAESLMVVRNVIVVLFFVGINILCEDCLAQKSDTKNFNREKILDEYLISKFSVAELLDFKFAETDIKEKDVYADLYNYYMFWAEQKRHFKRNPQPYLLKADSMAALMNSLKNDLIFHKITILQTKFDTIEDPFVYEEIPQHIVLDTIHYGIFYFNDYDSLVKVIHYK